MRYLQEGVGEISWLEFEGMLGNRIEVIPAGGGTEFVARITALEVTPRESHTSCIVNLDREPPSWLKVARQNAGYLEIQDWKHEHGRWFCPVEISGGWYDPAHGKGPFDIWLVARPGPEMLSSDRVSAIGWVQAHQHANLYVSLVEGGTPPEPLPEPPPEPPPDPDLERVKELIRDAQVLLDEALRILG